MFFIVNYFANHAHWTVVIFTFDRFLAVCFPFWTKEHQTKKRAWSCIVVIGMIAFIKNFHYIWTAEFVYNKNIDVASCGFGIVNKSQWVKNYQIFEIAISSIAPFTIIVILNTAILVKMHRDGNFSKLQHKNGGTKIQSVTSTTKVCIIELESVEDRVCAKLK
jgi:7 transmembrane receptor (rhodopsin family).